MRYRARHASEQSLSQSFSLSMKKELNECDARTTYPCMILRAMEGKGGRRERSEVDNLIPPSFIPRQKG